MVLDLCAGGIIPHHPPPLCDQQGGMGSYTQSSGMVKVRKDIAAFIEARDGYPSNPDDIIMSNGASGAITMLLNALLREPENGAQDGCLTPVPQYPLYSATLTALGGAFVPYYLNESSGWDISLEALKGSVEQARKNGVTVRALVVINPGIYDYRLCMARTHSITWSCLLCYGDMPMVESVKFCLNK